MNEGEFHKIAAEFYASRKSSITKQHHIFVRGEKVSMQAELKRKHVSNARDIVCNVKSSFREESYFYTLD